MHYLTDNPWPAMIVLGSCAVAALLTGHSTLAKLAPVFVGCGALVYVISQLVVSNREQVEMSANQILKGLHSENLTAVDRWISENSPGLGETARQGLKQVRLEPDFHIQSVILKSESDAGVVVQIRANGKITTRTHSITHRVAELWETTWVHESKVWKLSNAVRLNPLTHQPRSTFARR